MVCCDSQRGPAKPGPLSGGAADLIIAHTHTCAQPDPLNSPQSHCGESGILFCFLLFPPRQSKIRFAGFAAPVRCLLLKAEIFQTFGKNLQLPGTVVTFFISLGRTLNDTWSSEWRLLGSLPQLLTMEVLRQRTPLSSIRAVSMRTLHGRQSPG